MRRTTRGGVRSWSITASRRTPPSNGHCRGSVKPWPSLRLEGTARGLTTCGSRRLGTGVCGGKGVTARCTSVGAALRSCQATSHAGAVSAAVVNALAPRCRPLPTAAGSAQRLGNRADQAPRPQPARRSTQRTCRTSLTPASSATMRARGQPRCA